MNGSSKQALSAHMTGMSPSVFIFVALACEAKPMVSFFDLKKEAINHPFLIYRNDELVLTITGVGKIAMAGAIAYTLALFPHRISPVLLNMGIAGHKTHALGSLFMAIKIVDDDTGKRYYPPRVANNPAETVTVKTLSSPGLQYSEDFLYDMEASAFYEMAVKFSTSELIQCIKVISDNQLSAVENIQPRLVIQWLADQAHEMEKIIKSLLELRESIIQKEPDEFHAILKKWNFTVSGQIKLKALLMRWKVLSTDNWLTKDHDFSNGKDLLRKLENDVSRLEVRL